MDTLRFLRQFMKFLIDDFLAEKTLMVNGIMPWKDGDIRLGTKVEVVIIEDNTSYLRSNDDASSNRFRRIQFKIPKDAVHVKINDIVKPINAKAKVYGEFYNHLSIEAEDIKTVKTSKE